MTNGFPKLRKKDLERNEREKYDPGGIRTHANSNRLLEFSIRENALNQLSYRGIDSNRTRN